MVCAPAPATIPALVDKVPTWGSYEYRKALRRALQKAERRGDKFHVLSRSINIEPPLEEKPLKSRRRCCFLLVERPAPVPELSEEQWARLRSFLAYHFFGLNWHVVKIAKHLRDNHNIKVDRQQLMRKMMGEWGWDQQKFRKMRRMLQKL